jgi:hypothetical protein
MRPLALGVVAILTLVLLASSCASAPLPSALPCADGSTATLSAAQFRQHVLMFDSLGRMRKPIEDGEGSPRLGSFPILSEGDADGYRRNVVDGIRKAGDRVELLFFFHGGLNTRSGALQRAATDILRMQCEKRDTPLYPIFVNWQTSLPASYKDHLISVHKGHEAPGLAKALAWPFQLGSDLARAAIESPVAYYLHVWDRKRSWQFKEADKIAAVAPSCNRPGPDFFREGEMRTKRLSAAADIAKGVLMSPITLGGAGLIDAAGSSAWGAMIYTSDRLFFDPQEIHHDYRYTPSDTGAGGLAAFLRLLREDEALRKRLDITIVAHSAGAVVANKLISYFGRTLPIHNLVYMAPACTIDELMDGGKLTQFLRGDPEGRKLYILALHEKAELENQTFFGLAPRGTLLVWLDEFIQPKSSEFTGMMLGRARNLRLHVHLMPCDVQKQVFITAFDDDASSTTQPQTHGSFGELSYWQPAQWLPRDIPTLKTICYSQSQLRCVPVAAAP